MDAVDPLNDSAPPRYAIESDSEEDEANPLRISRHPRSTTPEFKILGSICPAKRLIIVNGRAGAFWARGIVDLGEQTGGVYVNSIQVGLLFNPTWAEDSTVLVSEALTRLPLDLMHPYAHYVLTQLNPSRVSMLDTYSSAAYSSLEPTSLTDAPVRYLTLSSPPAPQIQSIPASPFAPPNLVQSTTAAFLLLLSLPSPTPSALLLLLPSPQLPVPPPKLLLSSNLPGTESSSPDHTDAWPAHTMQSITRALLSTSTSTSTTSTWQWQPPSSSHGGATDAVSASKKRRTEIGEGGMYL